MRINSVSCKVRVVWADPDQANPEIRRALVKEKVEKLVEDMSISANKNHGLMVKIEQWGGEARDEMP